jgi:hypothetical protein
MKEPSPVTQATGLPGRANASPIEVARPDPIARQSPEWYAYDRAMKRRMSSVVPPAPTTIVFSSAVSWSAR